MNDTSELTEDQLLKEMGEFVDEDEALIAAESPIIPDLSIPLRATIHENHLDRSISLWSGIWIILASTIGSGIFASPGIVFGYTKSVGAALLVWVVAGILSITGALCYAELGAMMPVSGGEFTYLLRAYGSLAAFLFSFANILISRPASTAILSLTFGQYVAKLFDSSSSFVVHFTAIMAIICICTLNIFSARVAVIAQDILAGIKVVALLIISLFGILYMFTSYNQLPTFWFNTASTSSGDYALAIYSALWAYDGWNSLNLVCEELKNPRENLPKAVVGGPFLVMICYFFTNLGYFTVLEPSHVQYSKAIAIDFGQVVLGVDFGRFLFTIIVSLACASAAHANVFSGSRIIWNSSRNHEIPEVFSRIHENYGTPHYAILLLGLESIVFVILGDIPSLITFNGMIALPFYLLSALALIVLRLKEPNTLRPFKNWIIIPIIFSTVSLLVIIYGISSSPSQALVSFSVFGIGAGVWLLDAKTIVIIKSRLIEWFHSVKSRLTGTTRKEYFHDSGDNISMTDFYTE